MMGKIMMIAETAAVIIIMIIIIMIKNVGTPCSINGIIFLLECQELI